MKLPIRRGGAKGPGVTDTLGTSAGATSAGKLAHLDANGRFHGSFTMVFYNAGPPVDGTTFDEIAPKGALLLDTTNANAYINAGTVSASIWKLITRAA